MADATAGYSLLNTHHILSTLLLSQHYMSSQRLDTRFAMYAQNQVLKVSNAFTKFHKGEFSSNVSVDNNQWYCWTPKMNG